MNNTSGTDTSTSIATPSRGISLGWRLGLSTILIISLVMGSVSTVQQFNKLNRGRQMHQELLKMSLTPLSVRLEQASTLENMVREIERFHTAYEKKGDPAHEVILLNTANEPIFSTGVSRFIENNTDFLQASIPILSPLLDGSKGSLVVLKNSEAYNQAVRQDWLLWAVHFVVTVGVVLLFLTAAIYFQVTKPVNRLIQGVKKMEMGYWGPIDLNEGAWEIRWLAWRFGNMTHEVQSMMTHLFEAEQKARSLMPTYTSSNSLANSKQTSDTSKPTQEDSQAYQDLLAVCERLETTAIDDPQGAQLGHRVWQLEVQEANRLGFHQIKARLEDAALRLMEPDTYNQLDESITVLKASWQEWAEQSRDTLTFLLEEKTIPCISVLHRVKHTAGVWAKMQNKELSLEEIHDLFAFRIIVPTEADCYAALGVIHQAYKPEITRFKDYIAKPKGNGYSSLHTCVTTQNAPIFEIQIRSIAMDQQAERGDAAHWLYKEDNRNTGKKFDMTRWLNKLWFRNKETP